MSEGAGSGPKPFASSADQVEKAATLEELAPGVFSYTAEGDPNVGAVVGREAVLCVDARATPTHAREWLDDLREITDKPVRFLVLTHYHAVRVLGAAAFEADWEIAHRHTREWIYERGQQDFDSEAKRFPRLFRDIDSVPGLTRPNVTFADELQIDLGEREVRLLWLGRGHTAGDTVVWLPRDRIVFAGDLVEAQAAPYMGDAFINDWADETLARVERLGAEALVPGRGPAARGGAVQGAIRQTSDYLTTLRAAVRAGLAGNGGLRAAFQRAEETLSPRFGDWAIFDHVLPFNVARMKDELEGRDPVVWTAERDAALWEELHG